MRREIREEQEAPAISTAQQIRAALEPALAPLGLAVEDVTVSPAGRRRVLRVLVDTDLSSLDPADTDTPVPSLSLDAIAEATRAVDDAIDGGDLMGESPYTLEVSSPGVGRPLTTRDHFRRNVGRLVEVHHADGDLTGRVLSVDDETLTLEVPPTKKTPARRESLALASVTKGVVQVEFRPREAAPAPADDQHTEALDGADPQEEN